MSIVTSPVFGEMKFIYGWVKTAKISLKRPEYTILIEAEASAGQEILPIQEEQYKEYLSNEESFWNEVSDALRAPSIADAKFKPVTLRFERDGGVCVIVESSLDNTIRGTYRIKPVRRFEKLHHI